MILMMMWMLLLVTVKSELFQMMRTMMPFVSDAIPISEVVPGLIELILNGQKKEKRKSILSCSHLFMDVLFSIKPELSCEERNIWFDLFMEELHSSQISRISTKLAW